MATNISESTPTNAGTRLRAARESLGLSQAQMAADLRVTRGAISAWENGLRRLEGPALVALELRYGIPTAWISEGTGSLQSNHVVMDGVWSCPTADSAAHWDDQGELRRESLRQNMILDLDHVQGLLARSSGSLDDLSLWRDLGGAPPLIPPQAWVLLNRATQVRAHPTDGAIHLIRDPFHGPVLRILQIKDGSWIASPSLSGSIPSRRLESGDQVIRQQVLGLVLGYMADLI